VANSYNADPRVKEQVMSEKLYYEVVEDSGWFGWKVYHYDSTGNHERVVARSFKRFATPEEAADDCSDWQDDNGVDAELS
jgi:hypothetical protein